MTYREAALLTVSLTLRVMGYRRNHRNMMLAAAIATPLAEGLRPLPHGFMRGWHAGVARAAAQDSTRHGSGRHRGSLT